MMPPEGARKQAQMSATRLHRLAADLAEHGMFAAAEIASGGAYTLTGILRILAADEMPESQPGEGPALRSVGEDEPSCNEKQP